MHGQPHLSRRGTAYQWRRRIRVFSTKFVDLKLSLGTTDRRVATILARKISAESDTFMDGIIRTEISPQEARVWLADVIKRERAKIEKLQLLRRFDSLDPLDDMRRVKTLSSCRIVPIHARLIEIGFLDHVTKMKRAGHLELFPDLREPKSGKHGKKLGRRMRQIIDDTLDADGAALSVHSLRHYVQNALEHAAIDDKIIRDIVGHEGRDIHEKTYHKPPPT
tara:strand:+ start:486 stop:1151 length:666 start_codon:yes stop_codon:yes gene_type:complete